MVLGTTLGKPTPTSLVCTVFFLSTPPSVLVFKSPVKCVWTLVCIYVKVGAGQWVSSSNAFHFSFEAGSLTLPHTLGALLCQCFMWVLAGNLNSEPHTCIAKHFTESFTQPENLSFPRNATLGCAWCCTPLIPAWAV